MSENIYINRGHITKLGFLQLDLLGDDMAENFQKQLLLSHLGSCSECMDIFISELDNESELVSPPDGMEERILARVELERQEREIKQKRLRAIQYGKLVVAACMMMVVFFGSSYLLSSDSGTPLQSEAQIVAQLQKQETERKKFIAEKDKLAQEHREQRNKEPGWLEKTISGLNDGFYSFSDILNGNFQKGEKDNGK